MRSELNLEPRGNINKISFESFENFGQIELIIINFFICALILIFFGATNSSIQDTFMVKNSTWNTMWFRKYYEFLVFEVLSQNWLCWENHWDFRKNLNMKKYLEIMSNKSLTQRFFIKTVSFVKKIHFQKIIRPDLKFWR